MGAIATYGVWNYAPHWVQQVDSNVINSYLGTSRERYLEAQSLLGKDYPKGIKQLHNLVHDLSGFRKGDRQAKIAKQALLRLAKAYASKSDYESAALVLEQFLNIDEKDLTVRATLCRYMAKVPARRDEAIVALREWHQKFPMQHGFTEPLADLLAEEQQIGEGWQVHLTAFMRTQNNAWTLRWTEGTNVNRYMSAWLIPRAIKGGSVLTFQLPLLATTFELQLPPHNYGRYEKLSLTCEWDDGSMDVPILESMLNGVSTTNGILRIYSERPSIKLDSLHIARNNLELGPDERMTIHLIAKGAPTPSPAMAMYALKHRSKLLALADQHQNSLLKESVLLASKEAFHYPTATLYWHAKDQHFKRDHMLEARFEVQDKGDHTNYSATFPIKTKAKFVRFDLPYLPSFLWSINDIEIVTSSGTIHLDGSKPSAIVDLYEADGGFRIRDDDPYAVYKLGKDFDILSVKVTGSVR